MSEQSVTVVIPVWDRPYTDTVGRSIDSVRRQDAAVPIIVVDNASAVALPELKGVERVTSGRRLTAGAARNLGLAEVRTEYVIFLDADDELADGAIAVLLDGIGLSPTTAVFAMSIVEAETGRRHRSPRWFAHVLARAPRLFALATAVWPLYSIQGCAILRAGLVRDCGAYADADGGEDWVLAVSQAIRGRVVIDLRPGLVYHRRTGTLTDGVRGSAALLAACRRARDRLRLDPVTPAWMRAMLPLVGAVQLILVRVVRPPYRAMRDLWR